MTMTPTALLHEGLWDLATGSIPAAAQDAVHLRLLDTYGCLLAGAEMLRLWGPRAELLLNYSAQPGPAPVVGFDRRVDPYTAALVNGTSAHMAELDDGHRYGIVHAGVVILPALMAMAHHPAMSDASFMRGLLVGYEAAIRVAQTLQPEAKDLGWHGTGPFGAIGAAVGVTVALGGDKAALHAALSTGATSASGLLKVIRGVSELKTYNSGQAAQAGLAAGVTALSGFKGAEDVLGGPQGFLDIMGGDPDMDISTLEVRDPYCVQTVYLKPYASCRYAHAPVEATLGLMAQHGFTHADVARVEIDTFRLAIYQHDHTEITGVTSAKMSVPYCVAAVLKTGETGMAAFAPAALEDPEILDLCCRVTMRENPEMSAAVPRIRPAQVKVILQSGATFSARVDLPKGEPETAMTPLELRDKFLDLADFARVPAARAAQIADMILDPKAPKRAIFDLL